MKSPEATDWPTPQRRNYLVIGLMDDSMNTKSRDCLRNLHGHSFNGHPPRQGNTGQQLPMRG